MTEIKDCLPESARRHFINLRNDRDATEIKKFQARLREFRGQIAARNQGRSGLQEMEEARSAEARLNELQKSEATCEQAFNHSDEKAFAECLDPDIVLLTPEGDYHGRKAVMKYFKENYFGQDPPVLVLLTPRTRHMNGKVIWVECEISVTAHGQLMKLRGTALYQKTGERWLMSHMNYSAVGGN